MFRPFNFGTNTKIGNRLLYFHASTLMRSRKTETHNFLLFRDDAFSRTIKHWTYCFDISFRCDKNDRNGQFRSDFHPLKTADRTARRAPRAFPIFVKYENLKYERRQNYARGWGGALILTGSLPRGAWGKRWAVVTRGRPGRSCLECHNGGAHRWM